MAIEPTTYPMPRANRAGPASSGTLATVAGPVIPRTRLFAFSKPQTADVQFTWVSPLIRGPAIIRRLNYHVIDSGDAAGFRMRLKVASDNTVASGSVALDSAVSGDDIWEILTNPSLSAATDRRPGQPGAQGFATAAGANPIPYEHVLDYLVQRAEFFLKLVCVGSRFLFEGSLTLLEGADERFL